MVLQLFKHFLMDFNFFFSFNDQFIVYFVIDKNA